MCSSAFCTVLPWGSSTAFFGVMIIFAFIVLTAAILRKHGNAGERNRLIGHCNVDLRLLRLVENFLFWPVLPQIGATIIKCKLAQFSKPFAVSSSHSDKDHGRKSSFEFAFP